MLQDEQLIQESSAGSQAAFELLIQRWDSRMLSYFYRCTGSMEDAKDLRQELFLRVYQSRNRFKPNGKFTAWIYTIASNLAIDKVARKKTVKTLPIENEHEMKHPTEDKENSARNAVHSGKLQDWIGSALQQLPSDQRIALVMRHYEELTFVQIAQILETSESTVKTRVYRGLQSLKKELKRNGILEADCLQSV